MPVLTQARKNIPGLALYPAVINDAATGQFLNLITNVNATMSGGSTLLGQAKFRNDFQKINDVIMGYRASQAWVNLLYALDPDNPSGEGGTVGDWNVGGGNCTLVNTAEWSRAGSRGFKQTATAVASTYALIDVRAVCAAGSQYTAQAMFQAAAGKTIRLALYGDTSGYTLIDVVATGLPQIARVTKTFAAGDAADRSIIIRQLNAAIGDVCYWDNFMIVSGSVVPMFTEAECTATSCTFPTPFSAGEDVSFLIFIWVPYALNDGQNHYLMNNDGAGNNNIIFYKGSDNNLYLWTVDAANVSKIRQMAVSGAAGFHAIAASLSAANTQQLAIDGTLAVTTSGAGVRESAVAAATYYGTHSTGVQQLNGLILPSTYKGVVWDGPMCQRMSSLQAQPPRMRRVA